MHLPYAFSIVGEHRIVHMVDPEAMDWRPGFFTRGLPQGTSGAAIAHFDDWRAQTAAPSRFDGVGGIFHVSRCGSTLLAQNLKATGKAVVLSEPPFMRIMRTRFEGTLKPEEAVHIVAQVLAQWRDWAAEQGRVLILKFNSQADQWRAALERALDGASFVFLHREPVAVLESISRNPPKYLKREAGQEYYLSESKIAGLNADPLLKTALYRYGEQLDAFGSQNGDALCIGYSELEQAFPRIASHFGIASTRSSAWDGAIDAKADNPHGGQAYRAIANERVQQFAQENRDVLAVANARYKTFLSAIGPKQGYSGSMTE